MFLDDVLMQPIDTFHLTPPMCSFRPQSECAAYGIDFQRFGSWQRRPNVGTTL